MCPASRGPLIGRGVLRLRLHLTRLPLPLPRACLGMARLPGAPTSGGPT